MPKTLKASGRPRLTTSTKQFRTLMQMIIDKKIDPFDQPASIYKEHLDKWDPFSLDQFRRALYQARSQLNLTDSNGKGRLIVV
jgi:hypothetical protein